MEEFQCFFKILFPLFFFFLCFNFFPILPFSSAYTLPQRYFINCGSSSSTLFGNRTFISDENYALAAAADGSTFSGRDPNPPATLSSIYKTARIFKKPSFYELETNQTGIYIVRLHFHPFSNLTNARFDVLAFGLSILSNFSVQEESSVVVKEFFVSVNVNKFKLEFNPSPELESSFAFINAIEAFLVPDNFVNNDSAKFGISSRTGENRVFLQLIHRINVGGDEIERGNDTLMRNWVPDDKFLFSSVMARNVTPYDKRPNFFHSVATEFDAPVYVYQTAKRTIDIDQTDTQNGAFNVTWNFGVEKSVPHFVRVHFCDILNETVNGTVFYLYVNGGLKKLISPRDIAASPAAPFYFDFAVDSDSSGVMNLSIGLTDDQNGEIAFLNGVEIMQLILEQPSGRKNKHIFVVIGVIFGSLIVVFVFGVLLFFYVKSRKRKSAESNGGGSTERSMMIYMSPDMNFKLRIPLADIMFATNHFDPTNMIGEGGFGKVYKGILNNGVKVAVKRSEPGHGQGIREFQAEIIALSRIHYRHLVSLIGYCSEQDEMILVYEFMEKGTLRDHLYSLKPITAGESLESGSLFALSWDQRLEICIGAAKGLHYLHTGLDGPIIHRDIKSANILLDDNYVAKVADFGLSRSEPNDFSHISTDVKGSFGYLDPEYFRSLQLTQKSDVYSFGVVLLEALCARPAINNLLPREEVNLADWGMTWQKKGELEKIIDTMLIGKIDSNSLRKFGEIVEKCLKECGADRPNMVDVVWDLKYVLQLQHAAVKREVQYEDDTGTGCSWQLPPPVFQRLPSHIMPVDKDEESQPLNDSLSDESHTSASVVFSQLRINDAR